MTPNPDDFFASYSEWHDAMTNRAKIELTEEYCTERIRALQDSGDVSTKQFIRMFGTAYRDTVLGWFRQAGGNG